MSDSNGNGSSNSSADNSSADNSNELVKLQAEVEKFKNEYLYLRAEFDNYRKQNIKERADLLKYGAERLGRDLLAVLDNFERALSLTPSSENLQTYVKGIEITSQELKLVLNKNGIQELPSEGQPFNPQFHEALSGEPTNSIPSGHVLRVFQKGYKMHERIIRPAQVVVSQTPSEG